MGRGCVRLLQGGHIIWLCVRMGMCILGGEVFIIFFFLFFFFFLFLSTPLTHTLHRCKWTNWTKHRKNFPPTNKNRCPQKHQTNCLWLESFFMCLRQRNSLCLWKRFVSPPSSLSPSSFFSPFFFFLSLVPFPFPFLSFPSSPSQKGSDGQLGLGSPPEDALVPTPIPSNSFEGNVVFICGGYYHSAAITEGVGGRGKRLYCWGWGEHGQLGE